MMNKKKMVVTWIILVILICLLLFLNYVKFFGVKNENIEEKPVEDSSAVAIENALMDIVNNFNDSDDVKNLTKDGIIVSATLKNYSIFITYTINANKTTYEFNYSNLKLLINVLDDEKNLEKFNKIYKILIKSCQKRLKNDDDIDKILDSFLNDEVKIDAIQKENVNDVIKYQMDITKKISSDNINDKNQNNN